MDDLVHAASPRFSDGLFGPGTSYPSETTPTMVRSRGIPNASCTSSWHSGATPKNSAPSPSSVAVSSISSAAMPVSMSQ